jgi:hypothetical protein
MRPLRLERDGASGCICRPGPANVELAVDVDPRRIRDLVMGTLLGGLAG